MTNPQRPSAGSQRFGSSRLVHYVSPRLIVQMGQQRRSIQNHPHSALSRPPSSRRSAISSSASLRSRGTLANRAFRRCLILSGFSSTRRPASCRAISRPPAAKPRSSQLSRNHHPPLAAQMHIHRELVAAPPTESANRVRTLCR